MHNFKEYKLRDMLSCIFRTKIEDVNNMGNIVDRGRKRMQ